MINILRKHQQFLMILITILVIIAFVWLYNGTQFEKMVDDQVAKIYGRPVAQIEVDRQARRFQLCVDLGFYDMIQDLAGAGGFDREQMYQSFVWNSFVLRHEAERLAIHPTDDDVGAEIQTIRAFQNNGGFDPNKYHLFLQEKLAPRGFTTAEMEDLVRDQLRLRKIKSLLGSAVELSPSELRSAYAEGFQQVELSVIRLALADVQATLQVTEEDLKAAFEARKETLNSEEKRKVKLAKFELTEEEKKLSGKERIDALQKLANRAAELTQAVLEPGANFDEAAAKSGVPVTVTGEFTQTAPDPALAGMPAVSGAAFRLTQADPNSDVIQAENGFYVLRLESIAEAKPLTFAEARPKLESQLKEERAKESLNLQATEIRNKIDTAIQAGKSFADAAAAAGKKFDKIPAFAPEEAAQTPRTDVPDFQTILGQSFQLGERELSQFVPTTAGGLLIYVDRRLPLDEEKFAREKEQFAANYGRAKREMAFREWLRVRQDAAKIEILKS